jgi:kinesin family protein 20
MIVNINPYSTSYDENSHVMKFSAVARGVMTVQRSGNALVLPSTAEGEEGAEEGEGGKAEKVLEKVGGKKRESVKRVVRMSLVEGGEEEEVVYEGESRFLLSAVFEHDERH